MHHARIICGQVYSGSTGEPSAFIATSFALSVGAMHILSCSNKKINAESDEMSIQITDGFCALWLSIRRSILARDLKNLEAVVPAK